MKGGDWVACLTHKSRKAADGLDARNSRPTTLASRFLQFNRWIILIAIRFWPSFDLQSILSDPGAFGGVIGRWRDGSDAQLLAKSGLQGVPRLR